MLSKILGRCGLAGFACVCLKTEARALDAIRKEIASYSRFQMVAVQGQALVVLKISQNKERNERKCSRSPGISRGLFGRELRGLCEQCVRLKKTTDQKL